MHVILPHHASNAERFAAIQRAFAAPGMCVYSFVRLCADVGVHGPLRQVRLLVSPPADLEIFEARTLPLFAQLVAATPDLFPEATLPRLAVGVPAARALSRAQVAALLMYALMGAFPPQDADFNMHFATGAVPPKARAAADAKLLAVLAYFAEVARRGLDGPWASGAITVERRVLGAAPDWAGADARVGDLAVHLHVDGAIEDAAGAHQAVFANAQVGGGVLRGGCAQEEMRFAMCPELMAAILLCPPMAANEAIVVAGAERFARLDGYGYGITYAGAHAGDVPPTVVAFDALPDAAEAQWCAAAVERELAKAYCAMGPAADARAPFATGKWGCGVFGGDPHLKTAIQLLAAARAGLPALHLYAFGDAALVDDTRALLARLAGRTVADAHRRLLAAVADPAARGRNLYASL